MPGEPGKSASASARHLLVFSAANALILNSAIAVLTRILVALGFVPVYASATGIGATLSFLTFIQGTDSWMPMLIAVRLWASGQPIYDVLFFAQKVKFQYPLTSLLPVVGLEKSGLTEDGILALASVTSWIAVWLTIAVSIAILIAGRKQHAPQLRVIPAAVAIVLAGVAFYPLSRAFLLGQVQVYLTVLFALAVLSWIRGKDVWAGVLIGLMTLIKPQYALLVVWLVLRKKYRALTATLVVGVAGVAVSCMVFGWWEQVRYLEILSYISRHGESYYSNFSFNGIVHRLLFNGPNLEWDSHSFAPYHPFVYGATLVTSALILGFALLRPLAPEDRGGVRDLAAIAIAATVASPVAWDHHYGILFPIFVLMATMCHSRRNLMALAISYTLVSNAWPPFNALAAVPVLNVLQSLPLGGALMLLTLVHQRRQPQGTG